MLLGKGDAIMSAEKNNEKFSVLGMKPVIFIAFAAVVVIAMYTNRLPKSLFGGLAVCATFGYAIKFMVDHIKILKKTIGLATVSLTCAALVYVGFIPKSTVDIVANVINGKCDFLGFYVGALLCGSVIGMNRSLLIKAGSRYMVPVLLGVSISYLLGALAGSALGMDWKDVLLYIAGPIMGGGNGAGAVPMSEIYASISGIAQKDAYAKLYPAMTLGNWISIFSAIGLKMLGDKYHKLTGNGALMQGYTGENSNETYNYTMEIPDLVTGFFGVASFFIFGRIISGFFPSIHAYAFTILAVALVKIAGVLPNKVEFCIVKWYKFMSEDFTVIIMAGVGISMFNLATLFKTLSPALLVVCAVVVFGAILGAGLGGMLVKFYFVESAITAGLCMSNGGGNGDIMVLSAAERMELMSFAQISSRLGGGVILVIQSLLASVLLQHI